MQKFLRTLMLTAVMLLPFASQAQSLGDYTFSTGTDASLWIEVPATQPSLITPGAGDYGVSTVHDIGFSFPFGSDYYTQFSVNADGNLRLGSTVTGTSNYSSPFSTSNASVNNPKINVLGCDGFLSDSGYVRMYNTVDGSNNSLLVVEFATSTYTSSSRASLLKYQVHLYQNGNIVIVYAPTQPPILPATTRQCGLCVDATDLWLINASHVATHYTAGQSTTIASGTWPDVNRYYSFTRPIITCPAPSNLTLSNVTATSADVSWTPMGTENSWELVFGNQTILTTSTTYSFTGLTPNTEYNVSVRAICGSDDTSFAVQSSLRTECVAASVPYTENFDSYTTSTTAATGVHVDCWSYTMTGTSTYQGASYQPQIYYSSTNANSGNYSLRLYGNSITSLPPMDEPVSDLQISFSHYTTSANYKLVVGVMEGSTFIPIDTMTTAASTHTPVTVYFGSYTGNSHTIAFCNYNTSSTTYTSYHYIDDIVVDLVPTCPPVSDLAVSGSTENSITLTWTDLFNTGATYSIYNMSDTSLVLSGINALTGTVTGLVANRAYTFAVMTDCGGGDLSALSTAITGRTGCSATQALPYAESFDGYTGFLSYPYYGPAVLPACWIYYSNGTNTESTTGSSAYYGGVAQYNGTGYGSMVSNNPYLYMPIQLTGSAVTSSTYIGYETARGNTKYAVMPDFAQPLNTLQISFDYKMSTAYSSTGAAAVLELGYVTDGDITTFQSMLTYNALTSTQHVIELNLSSLAASAPTGARLAFKFSGEHHGTSTSSYSNVACGIDNILVENLPSCVRVTDLAASVTSNSVTLTWNDTVNSGATYTVSDATGVVASGINTTTYTITGLTPNTEYTFSVLANCSATDMSSSAAITVRTSCAAEELPFLEDFSATLSSDQCWRGASNATAAQVFSGTALTLTSLSSWSYASSTRDGLEGGHYYKNVYGTNQKAWMITPAIDLTNVTSAQLSFDVALTDYANAALPDVNGDTNTSQAFMVIVSTDGGNTWSANNATVWQNEGGDFTYASLASTTYQNKVIDLTSYVGNTIKIAFYTQSIWSGGDNDLHIDNIAVTQAAPTCPTPTITVDSFENRTISFSWTSTADSVIIELFDYNLQPVTYWFAPATGSVTNYTLPDDFPFGAGYVAVWSICGEFSNDHLSTSAFDAFAATCDAEDQCPVTFLLTDANGDGWNGGALDIYDTVSGLIVGSMTAPDYGLEDSVVTYTTTYNLCPGRVYSIVYRSGQYDDDVSFTILGPDSTVYGSFSNPSAGVRGYFTHICPSAADTCIVTLPFTETFEGSDLGCWTSEGDGTWTIGTGDYSTDPGAFQGNTNAKITHSDYDDVTKLISPAIIGGDNGIQLQFAHIQRNWAGDQDELRVYTRSSATADWQLQVAYTSEVATWTSEIVNIAQPVYQVAFEMTDGYGYGVAVDNVVMILPPSCMSVSDLSIDSITNNSMMLTWSDAANTGATYTVYNGTTVVATGVTGTNYTITGLTGNTSYTFGVVANCSATDASMMVTVTGTTHPDPIMCGNDEALSFTNSENVTGTVNYFPGYSYYNYSYSEVIVPATEIQGLGEIKGLEYYVNALAAGSSYFDNCEVYLMNTTATALTDGFIQDTNNLQLVYSGDLNNIAVGWRLVTFDSSFTYDGVSNILVAVRRNHGSYASSGSFGSYTAATQLARYVYRDSEAYTIGTITGGTATTNVPVYHLIGCEGAAPECMNVRNLTASDLTSTSVTLSWVDTINTGATYTIYNMADTSVVATGVTTTTYNVTGLTAETNYTFTVVANCSATSESLPISISIFTGYCLPNPTSVDGSGITSVSFGGMTNTTSHAGSNAAFVNNTTMAGSVPAGTTAAVDITYATGYTYGTIIWVDWDNSLTFDGNEVVYVGTSTNDNPSTLNATFDIPATQALGSYRMRIVGADMAFDSYTTSIAAAATADPCATFSWGVAEDYTLTVTAAPNCLAVTDLNVTAATPTSVTLSWTDAANTGATYTIYNMADTSVVATGVTATTYTVTGLTASTNYTFGVVANCSATDASSMVTITVSTECALISIFPYTQDFSAAPACWTAMDVDGDGYGWSLISGAMHSASYENNYGALTPDNWLITPHFQLTAGTAYEVTWNADPQDVNWPSEHYGLYVSTTGNTDTSDFTLLQEWTLTAAGHVPVVDLSSYAGQSIYLAFRHWNCTDWFRIAIDNFQLREQAGANQITVTLTQNNPMYGSVTGGGIYNIGDNVTVSATPSTNYMFQKWVDTLGVTVSTSNPYTFVAANDIILQAIFVENTGTLDSMQVNVAVNDATMGTTIPAPGTHYFYEGQEASVIAVPNNGYHLEGWSINVNVTGVGVVFDTTLITSVSDVFDLFGGWEVESGNGAYVWNVTANFAIGNPPEEHDSLTVITGVNNEAWGTVTPAPGTHYYVPGETVILGATPNEGYYISAIITSATIPDYGSFTDTIYAEDLEGQDIFDTIEVDEDYMGMTINIFVIFAPEGQQETYTVTVNYDPEMGTVTGIPTAPVEAGTSVTLTATANEGYEFVGWMVNNSHITDNPYTFTVTSDVTITAHFRQTAGINDADNVNYIIYSTESRIVVNGAENQDVYVYDINGRVMGKTINAGETTEFRMPTTGVYLVKIGNTYTKRVVVVR